ncbi:MAG: hypothetical protein QOE83_1970 [Actinomycetota bacterium]|nr:hypothetical protein [Actinomycetota bacterium]
MTVAKTVWRFLFSVVLPLPLVVISPGAAKAETNSCTGTWTEMSSPAQGPGPLNGIAAVSPTDVWIVGGNNHLNDTEQWDGSVWTDFNAESFQQTAVAAASKDDVWTLGEDGIQGPPVVSHWDGQSFAGTPGPSVAGRWLGRAAVPGSAWRAGDPTPTSGTGTDTVVEHWSGTAWEVQPTPDPGRSDNLFGMSATGVSDAWAVGNFVRADKTRFRTLAIHWNGAKWTHVSTPSPGRKGSYPSAVWAATPNDAWIVGARNDSGREAKTMTLHWDGTAWSRVPSPNVGPRRNALLAVSGSSSSDVWAVGFARVGGVYRPLVEHWNGAAWSVVSSPPTASVLTGVSVDAPGNVWVSGSNSIVAHLC